MGKAILDLGILETSRTTERIIAAEKGLGLLFRAINGLAEFEKSDGRIVVRVPDAADYIPISFVKGLFGPCIIEQGEDRFREIYTFDCTPAQMAQLEHGIKCCVPQDDHNKADRRQDSGVPPTTVPEAETSFWQRQWQSWRGILRGILFQAFLVFSTAWMLNEHMVLKQGYMDLVATVWMILAMAYGVVFFDFAVRECGNYVLDLLTDQCRKCCAFLWSRLRGGART